MQESHATLSRRLSSKTYQTFLRISKKLSVVVVPLSDMDQSSRHNILLIVSISIVVHESN